MYFDEKCLTKTYKIKAAGIVILLNMKKNLSPNYLNKSFPVVKSSFKGSIIKMNQGRSIWEISAIWKFYIKDPRTTQSTPLSIPETDGYELFHGLTIRTQSHINTKHKPYLCTIKHSSRNCFTTYSKNIPSKYIFFETSQSRPWYWVIHWNK